MIQRLISGGPTGVDRAALDVALALGLPAGDGYPRKAGCQALGNGLCFHRALSLPEER